MSTLTPVTRKHEYWAELGIRNLLGSTPFCMESHEDDFAMVPAVVEVIDWTGDWSPVCEWHLRDDHEELYEIWVSEMDVL